MQDTIYAQQGRLVFRQGILLLKEFQIFFRKYLRL